MKQKAIKTLHTDTNFDELEESSADVNFQYAGI